MYLMGGKMSEEHLIKAAVTSKALHNDRITPEDNRQFMMKYCVVLHFLLNKYFFYNNTS